MEPNSSQLLRYLEFVQSDPDNVPLMLHALELYYAEKRYSEAQFLLKRALELEPNEPKLIFFSAIYHLDQRHYDKAQALFETLLHRGVEKPAIYYNLALCQMYLHQPEAARDTLDTLLNKVPDAIPEARLLQTRALHHLNEIEAAKHQLEQYLALKPESAAARGYMALLVMDSTSGPSLCQPMAEQALQLDPKNLEALIVMGTLSLESYDMQLAEQYFERVLELNPTSGRALLARGITALLHQTPQVAEQYLLAAIENMPRHLGSYVALGWAQIALTQLDKAEKTFEKAISLNRTFGESHAGLAIVWFMQSRYEEARKKAKLAKRLAPGSISVQYAEALLKHLDGDVEGAKQIAVNMVNTPLGKNAPLLRDALLEINRQYRIFPIKKS